jgi:hypothetical protein
MSARQARLVFSLAARLGRTAVELEALSAREVGGWIDHFRAVDAGSPGDGANDGAIDMATLDRGALRSMFHR